MATSTSTALWQSFVANYDAGQQTLTLDGTRFGDQIANLLLLLGADTLDLTGVVFTPGTSTQPAPDTWSLQGTAALWDAGSCALTIAVAPGDQGVAAVTLKSTVASITMPKLVAHVLPLDATSASGFDALAFTNGAIIAVAPDNTLSYVASLAGNWSPFGADTMHLESVVFKIAAVLDEDGSLYQQAIMTATLRLGGTSVPVEIDVPLGGGSWSVGVAPPGVDINALTDIAELLGGSGFTAALPQKLVNMTALHLDSMILRFEPSGPSWSGIDLSLSTANPWPIANNIEITGVGLVLRVRPQASPKLSGNVTGGLKIGSLVFNVAVPIPLSGTLLLSGHTTQPLPGFGDFATLVDAPFAASLPDGVATLGSLSIQNVYLGYDLGASAVSSLGIDIAAGGPWTLIPNYLELDCLQFGVSASKSAGAWMIQGKASGTIVVATIRVAVAVEGGAGAGWDVKLTEPLLLPGIGELATLIGGHDAASALPDGFDANIGALTISRYEMAFGGQTNSLQSLGVSFATSNAWKFWDPYFVLENLGVALDVAGPTGTRTLAANIQGVLGVAGIDLVLSAQKPAAGGGWTFAGSLGPGDELAVGDLVAYLLSRFNVTAPTALQSFVLTDLAVTFVTDTKAFTFHSAGIFQIAGQDLTFTINFRVTPQQAGGFDLDVSGDFQIGTASFQITFDKTAGSSVLIAKWDAGNAGGVDFADIARTFGFTPPVIPGELDLAVTGAGFSYDFTLGRLALQGRLALGASQPPYGGVAFVSEMLNNQRIYLFDLAVPLGVKLSDIPVAGPQIPSSLDAGIDQLEIVYTSAALTADTVGTINTALTAIGGNAMGPTALDEGLAFFTRLSFGSDHLPLTLSLGSGAPQPPAAQTAPPAGGTPPSLPAAGSTAPAATPAAPAQAPGKWFDVGRSFGPLRIDRVGVQYQNGTLMFALDAGLALGPLAFSMDGLAVGSPLSHFSPVFSISGLGLSYNKPPLEISGAILKVPVDPASGIAFQFDGTLTLKAENFSLSAIGSYAQLATGMPSLFVFAQLESPLGGPPPFFVTGLMAGFGFNRNLIIPAQDEVASFPLLLLAQPPQPGQSSKQDPTAVLKILEGAESLNNVKKAWIAPQAGQYWLAAGLEFTSFELVHTKALLIAEFGNDLNFALLGLSTLQVPQPEVSPETYAFVEMMIRVVVQPSEGVFAATAILSKNSYVITPDCHLTGGFAFYLWFGKNANAGQFVVTLGGYHPAFQPPAYFPQVPRLGFNWAVSDTVSIKGDAYFALTGSCIMAGGGLEVLFQDGDLRAWFIAHADFLVSWHPFFYTAEISISIGASYRLNLLFCHKTITVSLGAGLKLWGPPTGGTVRIDLVVVSFSVDFGSKSAGTPQNALGWSDFKALLPAEELICRVAVTGGLYKSQDAPSNSTGKRWIVRAKEFAFQTQSAVPASHLVYGASDTALLGASAAGGIDIRPMDLSSVASTHSLKVYQGADTTPHNLSGWTLSPLAQTLPESLWGAPPQPFTQIPRQPSSNVLPGQSVGFTVAAPAPQVGGTQGPVPMAELRDETITPAGVAPLSAGVEPSTDYVPAFSSQTIGPIGQIMGAAPSRAALFAALGQAKVFSGQDGDLSRLAAQATHLYSDSPMQQN